MKTQFMMATWIAGATLFCFAIATWSDASDDPQAESPRAEQEKSKSDREKLTALQSYVGQWRGVGQPKRGSTKDAWSEECDWAWSFQSPDAVLKLRSDNGKYLRDAKLVATDKPNEFVLVNVTETGAEHKYQGERKEDGTLVLSAVTNPAEGPTRITIRMVADGDRMLVLHERQQSENRFARLAEVGFTRQGSGFGKGTSGIECVVTGGTGTIPVTHQGKTYYVCCTGCRDYFNENPDEVLAEYRARKEEEKAKK